MNRRVKGIKRSKQDRKRDEKYNHDESKFLTSQKRKERRDANS